MTTRQLVNELRAQGYNVTFYVRKDGGILIRSINGKKFAGGRGNIYARSILGVQLAERRTAQLTKITRERVRKPRKIPVETPEDLERFRKRVMRKWRKAGLKGSISKKNLRKIIEERGFEAAKTYLEEMERHSQGKAYTGQIVALLARLDEDMATLRSHGQNEEADWIQKLYDLINSNKDNFKEEWIEAIRDELYNWENRNDYAAHDLYMKVESLIGASME